MIGNELSKNFLAVPLIPEGDFLVTQGKLLFIVTKGYEKPFMGAPGLIKKMDFNFDTNIYQFEIEYSDGEKSVFGITRDMGKGGITIIRLAD